MKLYCVDCGSEEGREHQNICPHFDNVNTGFGRNAVYLPKDHPKNYWYRWNEEKVKPIKKQKLVCHACGCEYPSHHGVCSHSRMSCCEEPNMIEYIPEDEFVPYRSRR